MLLGMLGHSFGDILLLLCIIALARSQVKTLRVMETYGIAHTMSVGQAFIQLVLVHSLSSWAADKYVFDGLPIYWAGHWIAEAMLLAVFLYIVVLRIDHAIKQMRQNQNRQ